MVHNNTDVHPIRFIKNGTELEIQFIDADNYDTLKWYKGIVSNVVSFGNDENGSFIECDIEYDDGEIEKRSRLYDKEFNNEGVDSWKFVGNITLLLSFLMQNNREISDLKKDFYEKDKEIRSMIQDLFDSFKDEELDDSDSDSESDSKNEEIPNKITYIEVKQWWCPSVLGGILGGFLFFIFVPHLFRLWESYQQTNYYTLPDIHCIMSSSQ